MNIFLRRNCLFAFLFTSMFLINFDITLAADKVDFNQQIAPLLSENCYACHGRDAEHREAELRLDVSTEAIADRESGAAIVPGKPEESLIWQRIMSEDEYEIMPPPDSHKKLTAEQKELIRKWIEQGAEYEEHWSFVAPQKSEVPESSFTNPIDAFLEMKRQELGLPHNERADRRTLIRRVTLDLTGLPPTLKEVREFVADESDDAYEKLVDRLLSRPTYGENMARPWLDLARYA
ncbi:MAG TPA: hypothetical protein DD473_24095, partial [Planctomycetaceae bacterium]|nr:hypothetical protein [Planctomycetaceae bacterium]